MGREKRRETHTYHVGLQGVFLVLFLVASCLSYIWMGYT